MVSDPGSPAAPNGLLARLASPLLRRLSNLGVGKKLLLIYLLDLSTVIFISGILIHEKYIAIDFARKELAGTAYIDALRPTLIALGRSTSAKDVGPAASGSVAEAERRHGAGMGSAELNARLRPRCKCSVPRRRRHARPRSTGRPRSNRGAIWSRGTATSRT